MIKKFGDIKALGPTPVTVIGTFADGKPTWINIAHISPIARGDIIISMGKAHYTNQFIKENKTLSINLVNEEMLIETDYVGIKSGKTTDKSEVFEYFMGDLENAPLIKKSPVSMECELIDIYNTETHDNFIVRPVNTYVREEFLDENDSIDYGKVAPILFEMPNKKYLKTGKEVGDAWVVGKDYKK